VFANERTNTYCRKLFFQNTPDCATFVDMLYFFLAMWVLGLASTILGQYLYLTKALPALRRKRGHAEWVIWPSERFAQIDEYVSILETTQSRPWFYTCLKMERWVARFFYIVFGFFLAYVWVMGSRAF
jgi:hypothetical protein